MHMVKLPTPKLNKRKACGVDFYSDDDLYKTCGVRIAFTCRSGGVSVGGFESLNLAVHVEDELSLVEDNRRICMKALEAPEGVKLATLDQVHGKEVFVIDETNVDRIDGGLISSPLASADAIAVSSAVSNVAAMLMYADCVPVIVVAPNGAFAVIHSGWKGTIAHVAAEAVRNLCKLENDLSPNQLNAYIGPCIRSECFKVSRELAERFANEFGSDVVVGESNVDLPLSVRLTLKQAGLEEARICDLGKCSVCNAHEFFSYRASGADCGRHAAIAMR